MSEQCCKYDHDHDGNCPIHRQLPSTQAHPLDNLQEAVRQVNAMRPVIEAAERYVDSLERGTREDWQSFHEDLIEAVVTRRETSRG